ncbi:hypothetical protein [Paraburkholderia antibiotica]|uniref:Uncharacterized protein n=1 Tax=Paraburkholderia antibiotica TaxID=2728839 RepID=A0A7Y0FGA0_9BURK|nr:hypothetical protein [Paraburkholderia antibiotica]NML34966.1 hypothetical protein [Paraburkholderia antibiotica]
MPTTTNFQPGQVLTHNGLNSAFAATASAVEMAVFENGVPSVAAMQALDTRIFTTVKTLGYRVPGDSGHGKYYFVPTATLPTPNGVTVFLSNDGRGYWQLVHRNEIWVEQAGAYGDALVTGGGHNDTAAIQAAMNALAQNAADSRSISTASAPNSRATVLFRSGRAYLCDQMFWRAGVSLKCSGEALIVPSVAAASAAATFAGDAYTNTAIAAYDSATVTGGAYAFMFNPQGITQTQKVDGVYVEGISVAPGWNFAALAGSRPTVGGFDFSYMEKNWGATRLRCANLAGTAFNFDDAQDAKVDRCEALLCDNGRLVGSSQWNATNAVVFHKMRLERNIYCNHISWNKGHFPPRGNIYQGDKIEIGAEISSTMTHPSCLVLASDGEARIGVHDVPGQFPNSVGTPMWSVGYGGVGASVYSGFSIKGGLAEAPSPGTGQFSNFLYLDTDATVNDFTQISDLRINNMADFAIKGNTVVENCGGNTNRSPVIRTNDNIPQGKLNHFVNTANAAAIEPSQVFGYSSTSGLPKTARRGLATVIATRIPTAAQLLAGLGGIVQKGSRANALAATLAVPNISGQGQDIDVVLYVSVTAGTPQTVELLTTHDISSAANWVSRGGVITLPNLTAVFPVPLRFHVLPGHYWGIVVNDTTVVTIPGNPTAMYDC